MTLGIRDGVCSLLIACAAAGCAADSGPHLAFGLYHIPSIVDSISLELREDQTFRWSYAGCDSFGSGGGQLRVQGEGLLVLSPTPGEDSFNWPGSPAFRRAREVQLEVSGNHLIELDTQQRWEPGAVCPICGGPLGPTGQMACDHLSTFD